MLITKTVKCKWNGKTRKHYEGKGYIFTKTNEEFEIKVEDLTRNSAIHVDVQCDGCGEMLNPTWQDYMRSVHENGKYYCQSCTLKLFSNKKIQKTMLNKSGESFEKWCIDNNRQDILNRWSDKNKVSPKEIGFGSGKKYYFKCPKGIHEDELTKLNTLTTLGHEGTIDCKQCNSFAQYLINTYGENAINLYWDYEKNNINPWKIAKATRKKVWIKCQEKDYHVYETSCGEFYMGKRCSFCGNFKVHILDSLGTLYPQVLGLWSDKNEKTPYEYTPKSHEEVYWKCKNLKHDDYKRSIKQSNRCEFRCPECMEDERPLRMKLLCGENNHNYNPNLTDEEREFGRYKLYGESHKKWRIQIFKRDDYTCQCCKVKGGKLNAHHLNGWGWAIDERYDVENGITLCIECHKKFHKLFGKKNNTRLQFKEFMLLQETT